MRSTSINALRSATGAFAERILPPLQIYFPPLKNASLFSSNVQKLRGRFALRAANFPPIAHRVACLPHIYSIISSIDIISGVSKQSFDGERFTFALLNSGQCK